MCTTSIAGCVQEATVAPQALSNKVREVRLAGTAPVPGKRAREMEPNGCR